MPATVPRRATRRLLTIRAGAASADGSYVLLVGHSGLVMRWDVATGKLGPITSPFKTVDYAGVAFAPDGTALIVGDGGVIVQYTPPEASDDESAE